MPARSLAFALMATIAISGLRADVALAATAGPGFAVADFGTGIPSPRGTGFHPTTGLLYAIGSDGDLYTVPAAGGAATRLASIGNDARGLTFRSDGRLFVARHGTSSGGGNGDVVEVDPSTGALLGPAVAPVACADGIAAHPTTGDLYVTTAPSSLACKQVWRLVPGGTPVKNSFALVAGTRAIAISASGRVFVSGGVNAGSCWPDPAVLCSLPRDNIWEITGGTVANFETLPGQEIAGIGLVGTDTATGDPLFVMANQANGTVTKIRHQLSSGQKLRTASTGGVTGSSAIIGPDGCFYASQNVVLKVMKDGAPLCDLAGAGEAVATLSLAMGPSSLPLPPAVGERVTLTATLEGVACTVAPTTLGFTIVGANSARSGAGSLRACDSVNLRAFYEFSYAGANTGTDAVTASATIDGAPVTSNTLSITWRGPRDATPPIIEAKVTGEHGPASFSCAAQDAFVNVPAVPAQTLCGWYTGPPTLMWRVTEPDSPATLVAACPPVTLDYPSPPLGTPFTCDASSEGGNVTKTVVLQVALRDPTIAVAGTQTGGGAYAAGAITGRDVTVVFTCMAAFPEPFMSCVSSGTIAVAAGMGQSPLPGIPAAPFARMTATHALTGTGIYEVTGTASDITGRGTPPLAFQVKIDQTPPTITGSPDRPANAAGWYDATVRVRWSCLDVGAVAAGCAGAIPDTIVTAEGTTTATVAHADLVGNVGSGSFGPIRIDTQKPTIAASATANGVPYVAGTPTRFDVVVSFVCADGTGSGFAPGACPAARTVSTEGTTNVNGVTVADLAGNVSDPATSITVVVDKTAPGITATRTPEANADGWNNTAVLVDFSCDADAVSCGPDVTLSAERRDQTVTGAAADAVGNIRTLEVGPINIDLTDPTVAATVTGTPGTPGAFALQANVNISASDALAGVRGIRWTMSGAQTGTGTIAGATGTVLVNVPGTTTVTFTAVDRADNESPAGSVTVKVVTVIPTTLAITSSSTQAFSAHGATVSAKLTTTDGTPVAGMPIAFSAGGFTASGTTNASGIATAVLPLLIPGTYPLSATFAGNGLYLPSSANGTIRWAHELGISASTCGKVNGGGTLRNGAKVNVDVGCDGHTVRGKIDYENGRQKLVVRRLFGFGMTLDQRFAFVFGTTDDGKPVVVVIEDGDVARVDDRFVLRVNGTTVADARLAKGDLNVHRPGHCDKDRKPGREKDHSNDSRD